MRSGSSRLASREAAVAIACFALRAPTASTSAQTDAVRACVTLASTACTSIGWPGGDVGSLLAVGAGLAAFLAVTAPVKRQPAVA